jgi:hypothetical protein
MSSQLQTIATHPAIIGYDVDVYNYFAEQYVVPPARKAVANVAQDAPVRARHQPHVPARWPDSASEGHAWEPASQVADGWQQ